MRGVFFSLFFKTYLCKSKKNELPKNDPWSNTIFNTKKKCEYPLKKTKSCFDQNLPFPPYPCTFPRLSLIEHAFTKKTLMKLPFFIAISWVFEVFSESPYISRFLFSKNAWKVIWNALVIFFYNFLQNHHI